MKSILFLISILCVNMASANVKGEPVAGEIKDVRPLCPPNMMCITDGTAMSLEFELRNGCEEIISFRSHVLEDGTVEIEAIRGYSLEIPAGVEPVCASVMGVSRKVVSLNMVFPPFKVIFKGTEAVVDVTDYTK